MGDLKLEVKHHKDTENAALDAFLQYLIGGKVRALSSGCKIDMVDEDWLKYHEYPIVFAARLKSREEQKEVMEILVNIRKRYFDGK